MTAAVICSIENCGGPRRKRGWCDRHYQAWRRHGDPLGAKYEWAPQAKVCAACGSTDMAPQMRKFCSKACRQSEFRERSAARNESRAKTEQVEGCVACGVVLETGRVNGRAVHRRTRRFCTECKAKPRRSYRLAVDILAHYQGTDCGICNQPVDLTLKFPDKRCPTIDHKVPLAFGGTDAVENLRLAHYDCNCRREDYWAFAEKAAT